MTIENKNIEDFIIYCELIMDNFKEVDYKLKSGIVTEYSNFQKHFYSSSRYHAPGKKKLYVLIILFSLRKSIMHRSKFKNISISEGNIEIIKS